MAVCTEGGAGLGRSPRGHGVRIQMRRAAMGSMGELGGAEQTVAAVVCSAWRRQGSGRPGHSAVDEGR